MNTFDPFSACLYCDDPVENFEPGPRGGASQNMTCRRCGARYNLAIIYGQAVRGGQAIGKPGQPLFIEVLEPPSRNAVPLSEAGAQQVEQQLGVKLWPGYAGVFTRDQAEGAWPTGTRVVKTRSEPSDRYPDGTIGSILGSLSSPHGVLYFVEWETMPGVAVAVAWNRVTRAS